MLQRASTLRGLIKKPGIILGNSPSVKNSDKDYYAPFISIGVNRILRSDIVPNFILYCDRGITDSEIEWFNRYEGRMIVYDHLTNWSGRLKEMEMYEFGLDNEKIRDDLQLADSDYLRRAGTTPGYALQIAAMWGMNPIGLVGVDFNAPMLLNAKKQSHFYGDGHEVRSSGGGKFEGRNEMFYKWFYKQAIKQGIAVYNLSDIDSAPFHSIGISRMSPKNFYEKFKDQ